MVGRLSGFDSLTQIEKKTIDPGIEVLSHDPETKNKEKQRKMLEREWPNTHTFKCPLVRIIENHASLQFLEK